MRIVAVIIGAVIAFAIANKLVGFTSAVQGQKTMVLAAVFAAALCPLCYWVVAKGRD